MGHYAAAFRRRAAIRGVGDRSTASGGAEGYRLRAQVAASGGAEDGRSNNAGVSHGRHGHHARQCE